MPVRYIINGRFNRKLGLTVNMTRAFIYADNGREKIFSAIIRPSTVEYNALVWSRFKTNWKELTQDGHRV